jgi:proline iminopeptidase
MKALYPPTRPYKSGYLKVSDGYSIYYELCGNPKGKPILFLHGGPGFGIKPRHRRFFNPRTYNAILFDQRGCGKSRPFASIKNNTTWKLVEDINALLDYLEIKKTLVYGGSWGSTLALVYAIKNPKRINGLVLRGVGTTTYPNEVEGKIFPELWDSFLSLVPKKHQKTIGMIDKYYIQQMKSKDLRISRKYLWKWISWDTPLMRLDNPIKTYYRIPTDNSPKGETSFLSSYETGLINATYLSKNCFLPKDYLLKNAAKIKVPTVIINGRFDMMSPAVEPYLLHKKIKGSKLYFVVAAHADVESKLVEELDKFAKRV